MNQLLASAGLDFHTKATVAPAKKSRSVVVESENLISTHNYTKHPGKAAQSDTFVREKRRTPKRISRT